MQAALLVESKKAQLSDCFYQSCRWLLPMSQHQPTEVYARRFASSRSQLELLSAIALYGIHSIR
jgi:hypothetical protein